ncbi:MAG: SUMF1/EgtB/PvdO family nonheme iron enzyme [Gemmataceae bacterium]
MYRLAVLLALVAAPAQAANYAFLVACSQYDVTELKPLQYSVADVTALRDVLLQSGYDPDNVVLLTDKQDRRYLPEGAKIRKEFDLLLSGLAADDTVVVAFAGHGVQFAGEKQNYFCPLDAKLGDKKTLIALDDVYRRLSECKAKRKLLLVDACRNDPASELARSREVAKLESVSRPQGEPVPEGIVALFSCSAGQRSFEWPELQHGVFFHHVIEGWKGAAGRDGTVSLNDLTGYVTDKTKAFSRLKLGEAQIPQVRNDFSGTWVLKGTTAVTASPPSKSPMPPLPPPPNVARPPAGDFTNSVGLTMVRLKRGTFVMGSPPGEKDRGVEEFQHEVELTNDFYLGQTEVTVGQFRAFVEATGHRTDAEASGLGFKRFDPAAGDFVGNKAGSWRVTGMGQTDQHPVVGVSWFDARAFCKWLSEKEGRIYRLPTEAEWEYGCRAGSKTAYSFGNDPEELFRHGNGPDGALKRQFPMRRGMIAGDDGYAFTAPVKSFAPNAFGLYDMHGNVSEWCEDAHETLYYQRSPRRDPNCQDPTNDSRVIRGGSWEGMPYYLRSAGRTSSWSAKNRDASIGFRIALTANGP